MNKLFRIFQGDRTTWGLILALSIFSFMPVYSASANLAFKYADGNVLSMLMKHMIHLLFGIGILIFIHRIPYRYFGPFSIIGLVVVVVLLVVTLASGSSGGGTNDARWIHIPFIGISFQSSALASLVLMVYLSRFMAKKGEQIQTLKDILVPALLPIGIICLLVLPANFSTAALIFLMSMIVLFVGGLAFKHIAKIMGIGATILALFILVVLAFPNISNRVDTWRSRIESFWSGEAEENFQVSLAKQAIAQGKILGQGPGKSVQKNFLPQSNSDFIYAVIVEEFGVVGGGMLLFAYVLLLIRIVKISQKAVDKFGSLLALAVGMGVIFQSLINMSVAVNLIPVTGQTLPLISAGGSSIWMTCIALGIILSVSRGKETEDEQTEEELFGKNEEPQIEQNHEPAPF